MFDKLSSALNANADALLLRAKRQEVITSNIANADTPNYKAVDFDFSSALDQMKRGIAAGSTQGGTVAVTHAGHLQPKATTTTDALLKFRQASAPSLDGNTVDIEQERAAFSENAIKYEAALRALNGQIKTLQSAISGNGQ